METGFIESLGLAVVFIMCVILLVLIKIQHLIKHDKPYTDMSNSLDFEIEKVKSKRKTKEK